MNSIVAGLESAVRNVQIEVVRSILGSFLLNKRILSNLFPYKIDSIRSSSKLGVQESYI